MVYNVLKTNEFVHINFHDIGKKYLANYNENGKVLFTDIELKSILSLIFAYQLHLPELEKQSKEERLKFLSEQNYYFNISKEFGRLLLENLVDFKLEWFNGLKKQSFKLVTVGSDENLNEFVEEALIDQMNIRQWEYGKYFFQSYSNILDSSISYKKIQGNQSNQNSAKFWDNLYDKMDSIKEPIENYEAVLLGFYVKSKIEKQDLNMQNYSLLGSISCQKLIYLFKREQNLKQALNELLSLDQKLKINKGRKP